MIKEVTIQEFLSGVSTDVVGKVKEMMEKDGVSALVAFSSHGKEGGTRACVAVGPGCTVKSVEGCEGKRVPVSDRLELKPTTFCSVVDPDSENPDCTLSAVEECEDSLDSENESEESESISG